MLMSFAEGRTLALGSLGDVADPSLVPPFAVLLSAFDERERRSAEAAVLGLVDLGCVEFCCVGSEADQLHESIDSIVEDRGWFDIVTTGDADETEACEYFVLAAAGAPPLLVALVTSHPGVVAILLETIRAIES